MSSVRNFAIAFVISLLIFGICAYFAVNYVSGLFSAEEAVSEVNGPDSKKFDNNTGKGVEPIKSGRSFNTVIIGTDYDPQTFSDYTAPTVDDGKLHVTRKVNATAILFVRFDKEARAIRIASIPAETYAVVDYVPMTLGQAYAYKGGAFIKERVASLVGMTVDYLFEFSGREFAAFVKNNLLTKDFTVPITVVTATDKKIPSMSFKEGQTITSENALFTLLHHTKYTIAQVADRHKLLCDVFLQTLSKITVTDDPASYYKTVSKLHTDMTQGDVAELMEVLYTLPLCIGDTDAPTTVTIVDFYKLGSYSGGVFRPDATEAEAAFDFSQN